MTYNITEIRTDGTYATVVPDIDPKKAKARFAEYVAFVEGLPATHRPERVMVLNGEGIAIAYRFFDTV
jgi:hypothetical protein